jgi:hypothetical protein
MGWGVHSVFSVSIASAVSQSSAIDLGRSWQNVILGIPSTTSGTDYGVMVSDASDGTYRRLNHAPTNSAVATVNPVQIASTVTNAMVPLPATGFRFMKILHTSQTVDSSYAYKIICGD